MGNAYNLGEKVIYSNININFANELEIMEERMKRNAALCMLITLVDNNNGCINIGNDKVKRVFNDENEIVKIEYADGVVALAADADYDTINNAVLKWKEDNPQMFALITDGLSNKEVS